MFLQKGFLHTPNFSLSSVHSLLIFLRGLATHFLIICPLPRTFIIYLCWLHEESILLHEDSIPFHI